MNLIHTKRKNNKMKSWTDPTSSFPLRRTHPLGRRLWNVWLILQQLPIKAGWWDASIALRDFRRSNKHDHAQILYIFDLWLKKMGSFMKILLILSKFHEKTLSRPGDIKIFCPGRRMHSSPVYGHSVKWRKTINEMSANIPGRNFLGGNFPGLEEFSRGEFDGWEFSGWEFSRGYFS